MTKHQTPMDPRLLWGQAGKQHFTHNARFSEVQDEVEKRGNIAQDRSEGNRERILRGGGILSEVWKDDEEFSWRSMGPGKERSQAFLDIIGQ